MISSFKIVQPLVSSVILVKISASFLSKHGEISVKCAVCVFFTTRVGQEDVDEVLTSENNGRPSNRNLIWILLLSKKEQY